ncbi:MAG: segregation and condensation protein A [bacterium]
MQSAPLPFFPKVSLQVYDGPLDLLLALIKKNKINIYDIPIVEITNQYLEAIGFDENGSFLSAGSFNLDLGGDFIVMAAQLIYIKSVMLLPKYDTEKAEEFESDIIDPRAELTDMLLEYRKVKEVSAFLNNRPILGRDVFGIKVFKNDETLLEKIAGSGNTIFDANIFILSKYFYNKMTEAQNRINTYEVAKENFSVKEKIIEIMEMFNAFQNITFSEIVKNSSCRDELFTYFLALLEMARLVLINLNQIKLFGEIYITPTPGSLINYRSKIASMN